jgi:hypothetical protein
MPRLSQMSHRRAKQERQQARDSRTRTLRDNPELVDHLREQLGFLSDSAAAYDAGTEREGKRLAVVLRTLLHNTKQQVSLLSQLQILDLLRFVDTAAPIMPGNLLPTPGFVMIQIGPEGAQYLPPLSDLSQPRMNPPKPFDHWWTQPVTKLSDGTLHRRADWVLGVAEREGGAHVDRLRDPLYEAVTQRNDVGWVTDTGEPPRGNIALASVRQIAHEVQLTLAADLPRLLPNL